MKKVALCIACRVTSKSMTSPGLLIDTTERDNTDCDSKDSKQTESKKKTLDNADTKNIKPKKANINTK